MNHAGYRLDIQPQHSMKRCQRLNAAMENARRHSYTGTTEVWQKFGRSFGEVLEKLAMNILVAIDLSAASSKVVAAASRVAEMSGAEVYLLHVAEPEVDYIGYEAGPAVLRRQEAQDYQREHEQVNGYVKQLTDAGYKAQAMVVEGAMAKTTISEAKRLGSEWIVVGSHGHGAVYDMLVGSHSAALMRKSPVPVLVVPTRD
jgi:nucleotide-binding universal stress UspA family protein